MLFLERVECCVAVVSQGGCRLTGIRTFFTAGLVMLYWTVSQHIILLSNGGSRDFVLDSLPTPSSKPGSYFAMYVPPSKLDPVNIPKCIPYSAENSSVLQHRFLWNRTHIK